MMDDKLNAFKEKKSLDIDSDIIPKTQERLKI